MDGRAESYEISVPACSKLVQYSTVHILMCMNNSTLYVRQRYLYEKLDKNINTL